MEEKLIGIDIGSQYIKVCKVVNANKKNISVYSTLENVSKMDNQQKQMAIRNLMNKINIEKDNAFLAVGGSDIINRDVVLSKLEANSKDFKNAIIRKLKDSISENIDSMYTAYAVTRDISDKEICVLFSAVQQQKVKDIISLLDNFNDINVVGITMEALAVANAFIEFGPEYKKSENIMLLNIGKTITNLVVLNKEKIVFIKDFDFGGQNITGDIANVYLVPERLAEEIKIRTDLREKINFNMKNILKRSVSFLIDTVFRTIEYCTTRQLILSVDRIIITGGASVTEGLDIFIGETLGINTERWDPLMNNNIVGYSDKNYGPFISVALGLALEKKGGI